MSAESVAVSQSGELYMLDRYGVVWKGSRGGPLQRVQHLGGGRPLGFHFDGVGNLLICNAGLVCLIGPLIRLAVTEQSVPSP